MTSSAAVSAAALSCRRADFQLPEGAHYLNCAYMGPLPRVSEQAGAAALARKRLPTDITAPDAFWESDRARELFARLVDLDDPARVAIQPGVSYGVATAARNLDAGPGRGIVLTHEQFPGNVYSWRRLAAETGASLRMVAPPDGPGRGAAWNELMLDAIDSSTAVVAMPHVHWTDGTRFDLVAIGARCREVGAALVVDGTQSVGALDLDIAAVQPDALVCAAYKWLLGPYSVAFAYYGPRFDDGRPLEETWIARERSDDFQHLVDYEEAYRPGAVRYDVAERSNFFLLPIATTSLELLLEWRPERIQEYCRALTGELVDEATSLGFAVEDEAWRAHHLFGLRMPPTIDLAELREALARRNVSVSLRGSALRLSPNVYNDGRDMAALIEVLRAAAS